MSWPCSSGADQWGTGAQIPHGAQGSGAGVVKDRLDRESPRRPGGEGGWGCVLHPPCSLTAAAAATPMPGL